MNLLLDKTLEYFKCCDPNAEIVILEIATLYETLLDSAIDLTDKVPQNTN